MTTQIIRNLSCAYQCLSDGGQGDLHPIKDAALVFSDTIEWIGREEDLPSRYQNEARIDARRAIAIPGLIDCHTHLAFGGWRADEFELRMLGKSYLEIAKAGGGIASSVKHTRSASEEELLEKCLSFVPDIAALGVTTIECKSGYGLSLEDELKQLRVYKRLAEEVSLDVVSTCLGAHIVPPDWKDNRSGYIDLLKKELIPQVAEFELAKFFDVFVEETAFVVEEAEAILNIAKEHGLSAKLHVDQLSSGQGAELAARVGAISADHLECVSDQGVRDLKQANVVAVTLPLASLYTRQTPLNARRLIEKDVPVAVATDFNPGSAPSFHLPLAMMLACTMNQMTPAEALKGATVYAAKALSISNTHGSLESGKVADIALLDVSDVNKWLYHFNANNCVATFKGGKAIYQNEA